MNPAPADDDREDAARARRHEHGAEQADRGGREQRERRRQRQPVDLRGGDRGGEDHGVTSRRRRAPSAGNVCSVIDDGHTERASRIRTSGTTRASSPRRRSSDSSRTASPAAAVEDPGDQPQRVHRGEHDRAGADGRVAPALREDTCEDRELTREVGRPGHGEREHADDHARSSRAPAGPSRARRARRSGRCRCAGSASRRAGTSPPRRARG